MKNHKFHIPNKANSLRGITMFTIFYFLLFCYASGQSWKIQGKVINEDSAAIPFATIRVFQDSSFLLGTASDEQGNFTLEVNNNPPLILKIQSVGYSPFEKTLAKKEKLTDLGFFTLNKTTTELDEILVSAQKMKIEKKIDRIAYHVENSVLTKGRSAWEALGNIPNIVIDTEGNIMIPGKKTVSLIIDNRRINLSPAEVKVILESIPAEEIVSVEVITMPPAKYEAEGIGGIVRIVTKKVREKGFKGNFRLGAGKSTYSNYNAGGTFNYNTGKINILTGINYSDGKYRQIDNGLVTTQLSSRRIFNQRDRSQGSYSGKIGMDYQVNKQHFIGLLAEGGITNIERSYKVQTSFYFDKKQMEEELNRSFIKEDNFWNAYNFTYDGTLQNLSINASADYLGYGANKNQKIQEHLLEENIGKSNSDQKVDIFSSSVDFAFPIGSGKMETGLKWNTIKTRSDVAITFNEDYSQLPNVKDLFLYNESTQAAYASLFFPFSNKLELKLGTRIEHTLIKSNSISLSKKFNDSYTKLFPVAYLLYNFNDNHSLNFNLGRRINRPGYFELNPFRYYSSPYSYAEGNPFLQPYFAYNINLDYTFEKSYVFSLYYQLIDNPFSQIPEQGENAEELRYVRRNVADQYIYGINAIVPLPVNKWWTIQLVLDAWVPYQSFNYLDEKVVNNQFTYYGSLNNSFTILNNTRIELKSWYTSSNRSFIYESKDAFDLSFGIGKSFLNDQLNASFSVSDIFKTNPPQSFITLENIKAAYDNVWDSRFFTLSISYQLGKDTVKSTKQRNKSNNDEAKRLN